MNLNSGSVLLGFIICLVIYLLYCEFKNVEEACCSVRPTPGTINLYKNRPSLLTSNMGMPLYLLGTGQDISVLF